MANKTNNNFPTTAITVSKILHTHITTDECMVVSDSVVGKTVLPSTQSRLPGARDAQERKLSTTPVNVCVKTATKLLLVHAGRHP